MGGWEDLYVREYVAIHYDVRENVIYSILFLDQCDEIHNSLRLVVDMA